MKSFMLRKEDTNRKWHLVDVKGKNLGRAASEIAKMLMGKDKVEYTFHIDNGDFVVVTNAAEIAITGKKFRDKRYYRPSRKPGNLKETSFREMMEKFPTRALELAVKRMLPKNRIGRHMFGRLRVFASGEHTHGAQKPVERLI